MSSEAAAQKSDPIPDIRDEDAISREIAVLQTQAVVSIEESIPPPQSTAEFSTQCDVPVMESRETMAGVSCIDDVPVVPSPELCEQIFEMQGRKLFKALHVYAR